MTKPAIGATGWGVTLNAHLDTLQPTATLEADVASKVGTAGALDTALSATYARSRANGAGDPLGATLRKYGVVLSTGAAAAFDEDMVESPVVMRDPKSGRYVMVYVGYDTAGRGRAGYAYSDDLKTWEKAGVLLAHSGTPGAPDENGVTGPVLYWDATNNRYVLYYIGLTSLGYEAGTKTICYATADDLAGPWTRAGSVITASGSGWRSSAVWHVSVVERAGTWYCFFNATGNDAKERIGYATAPSLTGPWTVDDANSPVVDVAAGTWESTFVGDPSVRRVGDLWVMDYYGYNGSTAGDGIAVTSDAAFPLGWVKHSGNPILTSSEAYDSTYAHKPFVLVDGGVVYHYYTAVNATDRVIALATSEPPGIDAAPAVSGSTTAARLNSLLVALSQVGLSADVVSDSFTRADGAMGTTDSGHTWVAGGGAGWAIVSNEAKWTGASDGQIAVDSGVGDNYALSFTVKEVNGQYPFAVVVRGTSATSFVKIHRDQVANTYVINGSTPQLGTSADVVAGDVIRIEVRGTTVTVFANGTEVATWSGVTGSLGGTFQGIGGAGGLQFRADDFKVTTL